MAASGKHVSHDHVHGWGVEKEYHRGVEQGKGKSEGRGLSSWRLLFTTKDTKGMKKTSNRDYSESRVGMDASSSALAVAS